MKDLIKQMNKLFAKATVSMDEKDKEVYAQELVHNISDGITEYVKSVLEDIIMYWEEQHEFYTTIRDADPSHHAEIAARDKLNAIASLANYEHSHSSYAVYSNFRSKSKKLTYKHARLVFDRLYNISRQIDEVSRHTIEYELDLTRSLGENVLYSQCITTTIQKISGNKSFFMAEVNVCILEKAKLLVNSYDICELSKIIHYINELSCLINKMNKMGEISYNVRRSEYIIDSNAKFGFKSGVIVALVLNCILLIGWRRIVLGLRAVISDLFHTSHMISVTFVTLILAVLVSVISGLLGVAIYAAASIDDMEKIKDRYGVLAGMLID